MMADTYLRRGQRRLRRWIEDPAISAGLWAGGYGLGGFLLSAASIRGTFQPIAMGLLTALSGWQAVAMTLGAMLGYRFFWGTGGIQGTVWAAAGGMAALLLGKRKKFQQQTLMTAMIGASLMAGLGLVYQLIRREEYDFFGYCLRVAVAGGSAALGNRLLYHRDCIVDWLAGGTLTLGLSQIMPIPYLGLGYGAAGLIAVTGAFPGAALAGMGLDLAGITHVPMTAVMCVTYLLRMIPYSERWVRYCCPGAAYLITSALCGIWDPFPLPGLILGGGLGLLMPARPDPVAKRGPTGGAQVRLELSARVMSQLQSILLEQAEPAIDREALVQKARGRACSRCPYQKECQVKNNLHQELLDNPLSVTCRKTGRLVREIQRSQEQMRVMKMEQQHRTEFRIAMIQQYRFLSLYLQNLADQLPRRSEPVKASYCVQVSARSHRKEQANGDRCIAFPGVGCRYYVLLCDGMGTGLGAAEEGRQAADLIRQMLSSGFPPEYALQNINSLLTLRGQAGAVTADLCELRLDCGKATLYKWGAAPSWLIRAGRAEKIGTATPPPGISVTETREAVMRLSLSRGEVVILLSDGVDGEAALHRLEWSSDVQTGDLAETLLKKGCAGTDDDATVAVIRLRPASLAT